MAETRRRDNRRETPIEPDPAPLPPAEEIIVEPKVSVIIVAYNQAATLRRSIAALEKSTGRELMEILVVDCGSQDDSAQLDVEFEGVTMLRLPHHFGSTKAMNIATRTAKAEFAFYLSPNVVVQPDTVMRLADRLEAENDVTAAAPVLLDANGTAVSKGRSIPTRQALDGAPRPIDLSAESVTVEFADFNALMVRKVFIKGMNYFSERYGNSWADADLAMQIRRAQKKIRLYPEIRATWYDEPDPLAGDPLLEADRTLGASAFFGKYDGFFSGLTFRIGAIFSALGRFQFKRLTALLSGQKLDGSQAM
jgi:glycosyltransferase involved in cell wall biosynthesis